MVMRNKHSGDSPGWWDDLPARVRDRFRNQAIEPDPAPASHDPAIPRPDRFRWLHDASRLALLFLAVAIADLLFILICLSFLAGSSFLTPVR